MRRGPLGIARRIAEVMAARGIGSLLPIGRTGGGTPHGPGHWSLHGSPDGCGALVLLLLPLSPCHHNHEHNQYEYDGTETQKEIEPILLEKACAPVLDGGIVVVIVAGAAPRRKDVNVHYGALVEIVTVVDVEIYDEPAGLQKGYDKTHQGYPKGEMHAV